MRGHPPACAMTRACAISGPKTQAVTQCFLVLMASLCYHPDAVTMAPDPCTMAPCQNDGTCATLAAGAYNCSCVEGWTGDNCSEGGLPFIMAWWGWWVWCGWVWVGGCGGGGGGVVGIDGGWGGGQVRG